MSILGGTVKPFKGVYIVISICQATLTPFKGSYKHLGGHCKNFKCSCKHPVGLRWPHLPFARFLVSQDSARYMSNQSNYCRAVWNFACHAQHALEFLENIYSIYAKSGCDAGADKLKRHSCSIKDLWNYIL